MIRASFLLALLTAGPVHAALPTWIRIVEADGSIVDLPGFAVDSIQTCPISGFQGMARIAMGSELIELRYTDAFVNEGAVTWNPNTTGDQLVLIESVDGLHGSGFEACTVATP